MWIFPVIVGVMVLNVVFDLAEGLDTRGEITWFMFHLATTALLAWCYVKAWQDGRFRQQR